MVDAIEGFEATTSEAEELELRAESHSRQATTWQILQGHCGHLDESQKWVYIN